MLCSICNKNTAVVFVNKPSSDGNNKLEGLCYECAKKKGINPIDTLVKQANLSETDIEDMTRQFEDMFKDISNNLDNVNPDDLGLNESGDLDGSSLGSIFSGIFNSNSDSTNSNSSQPDRKKIKVKKKNNDKKRKNLVFLFLIFTLYRIIYIILYDNNKFFNMCKANIYFCCTFLIFMLI